MNLNQVTVPSRNVAESVAFYRKLGLKLIVDAPHYARFECPSGDATFSIHHTDSPDVGQTVVYFEVDDVDAVVGDLVSRGLTFDSAPRDEAWLWREARLHDPSGNTICIYHAGENRKNPPWRISPS